MKPFIEIIVSRIVVFMLFPIRANSKWKSDRNTTLETCCWIFAIDRFESFDQRAQKRGPRNCSTARRRWPRLFLWRSFCSSREEIHVWIETRGEIWLQLLKVTFLFSRWWLVNRNISREMFDYFSFFLVMWKSTWYLFISVGSVEK